MTDREDRIRELAYLLWLEEGYPEGEAERHWLTAEAIIDSEPLERKRIEGEPPGDPTDDSLTVLGAPRAGATAQTLASTRRALQSLGRRLSPKTADHKN
jgi:Protein of unknown function (DUF2934)